MDKKYEDIARQVEQAAIYRMANENYQTQMFWGKRLYTIQEIQSRAIREAEDAVLAAAGNENI